MKDAELCNKMLDEAEQENWSFQLMKDRVRTCTIITNIKLLSKSILLKSFLRFDNKAQTLFSQWNAAIAVVEGFALYYC